MINLTTEEWQTLQNICQEWQVECPVMSTNSELFSVLVRVRHKMLKAIPTMDLAELQNQVSKIAFVGKGIDEINKELVEEEKLTKELRQKCLDNLK